MNVRIKFNADIRTSVWLGDEFMVNNYAINLQLITQSHDPEDHPVCLGRIRTILDQLEHSILINQDHVDKIKELTACGFRVVALPQEPIDQIMGIVLFQKLDAVLENRMRVTDLDLCSDVGDNIWFMHSAHELVHEIPSTGWWADATPVCVNPAPAANKNKVVKLNRQLNWKTLELNWSSDTPTKTVIININDDK